MSVGGQIANTLALPLFKNGYYILGTNPISIDRAEDRKKFSSLLHTLHIDQPAWTEATNTTAVKKFSNTVGYPILLRPSYVLSGAAMNVIYNEEELQEYMSQAAMVSPDHPAVVSQFLQHAKELEVDGVADRGTIIIQALTEHVEHAGVHSGDATVVMPPQRLYLETVRRAKRLTKKIVRSLEITGPFNIQFLAFLKSITALQLKRRP